jgi:predicted membrane channel-forming protein YqfA (hemolysin III family)
MEPKGSLTPSQLGSCIHLRVDCRHAELLPPFFFLMLTVYLSIVTVIDCRYAGTYTPIAHLGLGGAIGNRILVMVWTGAAAGILQSFFWAKAPKAIATSIYIVLGWIILPHTAEVCTCPPDFFCCLALTSNMPSCSACAM